MCTPLRSPKMYGFILGFQRWVWWPKCAPASSNCCMVTSLDAMVVLLPVMPLRGRESRKPDRVWPSHRYDGPACGMRAHLARRRAEINPPDGSGGVLAIFSLHYFGLRKRARSCADRPARHTLRRLTSEQKGNISAAREQIRVPRIACG